MYSSKCKVNDLTFNLNGEQLITLNVQSDFTPFIDNLIDKELEIEIKEYKKKGRSMLMRCYGNCATN